MLIEIRFASHMAVSSSAQKLADFMAQQGLLDCSHLVPAFECFIDCAAVLGTASCEKMAHLWCGPKGIGKSQLLRCLCKPRSAQSLVEHLPGRGTPPPTLLAVYLDLNQHPAHDSESFTFKLCVLLSKQLEMPDEVGVAQDRAAAVKAGLQQLLAVVAKKAQSAPSETGIYSLNMLLSENNLSLVVALDEAENLYKQCHFSELSSELWVRDLMMLTALAPQNANVSIGSVLCCSLARARQLFFRDEHDGDVVFPPEYKWSSKCVNWNETKFSALVCTQPSWTVEKVSEYIRMCKNPAPACAKRVSESPMQLLMEYHMDEDGAAAAGANVADAENFPPEVDAVAAGGRPATLTDLEANSASKSSPLSATVATAATSGCMSGELLLECDDALQLLMLYTGGNLRALKDAISSSSRLFTAYVQGDRVFLRDDFLTTLDSMALEYGWEVSKTLSESDMEVITQLLQLLPDHERPLNLRMSFEQSKFAASRATLARSVTPAALNAAADSGAVYVSRVHVALSSPAVLFRYSELDVEMTVLRWMLHPLGAFAERLELPVAQAMAPDLLPAAFAHEKVQIQTQSSLSGPQLVPFGVAMCTQFEPPHNHFLNKSAMSKLGKLLSAKETDEKADTKLLWLSIVEVVRSAVNEAVRAKKVPKAETQECIDWVLTVLLAHQTAGQHAAILRQPEWCFGFKEYPDVYGGDVLFVRCSPQRTAAAAAAAGAGANTPEISVHRVQVKVATPISLRKEHVLPRDKNTFDNSKAAVRGAINGLTNGKSDIQANNARVAYFVAAVQAATQLISRKVQPKFDKETNSVDTVVEIWALHCISKTARCSASLATTHRLAAASREACFGAGISAFDCYDLYKHWGDCGKVARTLRALPFWLPQPPTVGGHEEMSDQDATDSEFVFW